MVGFIVDRIHVGTPLRDVVREFYRRMRHARRRGLGNPDKLMRKQIYREAIERHLANRQVCIDWRF